MIDIRTMKCNHWKDEYCEDCDYDMAKAYNKLVAEIEKMKETELVSDIMACGLAKPKMTLKQMREMYADWLFMQPILDIALDQTGLRDRYLQKRESNETDLCFEDWVQEEGMN